MPSLACSHRHSACVNLRPDCATELREQACRRRSSFCDRVMCICSSTLNRRLSGASDRYLAGTAEHRSRTSCGSDLRTIATSIWRAMRCHALQSVTCVSRSISRMHPVGHALHALVAASLACIQSPPSQSPSSYDAHACRIPRYCAVRGRAHASPVRSAHSRSRPDGDATSPRPATLAGPGRAAPRAWPRAAAPAATAVRRPLSAVGSPLRADCGATRPPHACLPAPPRRGPGVGGPGSIVF